VVASSCFLLTEQFIAAGFASVDARLACTSPAAPVKFAVNSTPRMARSNLLFVSLQSGSNATSQLHDAMFRSEVAGSRPPPDLGPNIW
jgi:hypothetical protein